MNLHRDRVELEQGKTSINSCQADPEKVRGLKGLGTGRNRTRVNFKLHGGQGFLNFKYFQKNKNKILPALSLTVNLKIYISPQ